MLGAGMTLTRKDKAMTNDAIELKDCPFCGRAAHKTERFCKADCPDAAAQSEGSDGS